MIFCLLFEVFCDRELAEVGSQKVAERGARAHLCRSRIGSEDKRRERWVGECCL
jgi:hypothetical protein